jgi:hypothetical protein
MAINQILINSNTGIGMTVSQMLLYDPYGMALSAIATKLGSSPFVISLILCFLL